MFQALEDEPQNVLTFKSLECDFKNYLCWNYLDKLGVIKRIDVWPWSLKISWCNSLGYLFDLKTVMCELYFVTFLDYVLWLCLDYVMMYELSL